MIDDFRCPNLHCRSQPLYACKRLSLNLHVRKKKGRRRRRVTVTEQFGDSHVKLMTKPLTQPFGRMRLTVAWHFILRNGFGTESHSLLITHLRIGSSIALIRSSTSRTAHDGFTLSVHSARAHCAHHFPPTYSTVPGACSQQSRTDYLPHGSKG